MKPFIFDYKKYDNNTLSIEQLDGIANIVLQSGAGKVNSIIAAVKLVLIFAWLIARKIMIDNKKEIEQQKFLIEQNAQDHDQVTDPFGKL